MESFDAGLHWRVPAKDANGETANSLENRWPWIGRVEPVFVRLPGQPP